MKTCFGVAVAAPFGLLLAQAASACATCGCSLNADAVTGYSTSAGLRLSVQYDYLHQDELRQGTGTAAGVPPGDELERETLNRYVTAGVSYSPSADWRLDLRLPYVIRSHSTYGEYDPGQSLALSSSYSSSVGDGRLIVSYQGLLPTRNLGLQIGIKVPTGAYGTHVNFSSGPLAATPSMRAFSPARAAPTSSPERTTTSRSVRASTYMQLASGSARSRNGSPRPVTTSGRVTRRHSRPGCATSRIRA